MQNALQMINLLHSIYTLCTFKGWGTPYATIYDPIEHAPYDASAVNLRYCDYSFHILAEKVLLL